MKISRIRDVKLPIRSTKKSAGIDFFIPKFTEKFKEDFIEKNPNIHIIDYIILNPNQRVLIPSGIKVKIPEGFMLSANNKSGVSTKKGLDVLANVVDEDYQGEIHISLVNTSLSNVIIEENEKIVQFILIPVLYDFVEEVPIEELYEIKSERGEGGFGSTN